jgi:TonB family protein
MPRGVLIAIMVLGCPFALALALLFISIAGGIFAYFVAARSAAESAVGYAPAEPLPGYSTPEPEVADEVVAEEVAVDESAVAPVDAPGPGGKPEAGRVGELDPAVIKKVIQGNVGRFKYCYDKELHASPTLEGKVVVKLVIGPKGTVTKASIDSSSLGNKNVEACVLKTARKMKFPRPKGGSVVVSYPFVFASAW